MSSSKYDKRDRDNTVEANFSVFFEICKDTSSVACCSQVQYSLTVYDLVYIVLKSCVMILCYIETRLKLGLHCAICLHVEFSRIQQLSLSTKEGVQKSKRAILA